VTPSVGEETEWKLTCSFTLTLDIFELLWATIEKYMLGENAFCTVQLSDLHGVAPSYVHPLTNLIWMRVWNSVFSSADNSFVNCRSFISLGYRDGWAVTHKPSELNAIALPLLIVESIKMYKNQRSTVDKWRVHPWTIVAVEPHIVDKIRVQLPRKWRSGSAETYELITPLIVSLAFFRQTMCGQS